MNRRLAPLWQRLRAEPFSLLMLLMLWGFTSKVVNNYLSVIAAVAGICLLFRSPLRATLLAMPQLRLLCALFLCLWLPQLVSLPDAVQPAQTGYFAGTYLRFFFMGVLLLLLSRPPVDLQRIQAGTFYIVLFWCLDALLQYFTGFNLLGHPRRPGDITGMFHPYNTISHVCAAVSPLYFQHIRERWHRARWLLTSLLPLFAVIFISGRRAAWIMLILSVAGYATFLLYTSHHRWRTLALMGGCAICIGLCLTLLWHFDDPLQKRTGQFARLLGAGHAPQPVVEEPRHHYVQINQATSLRLPIWEGALRIWREHPVNGVGVRGFRYAFFEHMPPERLAHSSWPPDYRPNHPHLLIGEVLAETGLLGAFGYLLCLLLLLRQGLAVIDHPRRLCILLCALIMLFPLNAHMSFYDGYLSSLLWWFLFLWLLSSAGAHR